MKRRAAAQSALFAVARNCLQDQGWRGNLAPGTAYLAQDFLRLASCVVLSKDRLSSLVRIGDAKPTLPPSPPLLEYLHGFPSPLTPSSRSAMVHVNSYLSDRFGNLHMELRYCRAGIKSLEVERNELCDEKSGMESIRARFKRSLEDSRGEQLHRNLKGIYIYIKYNIATAQIFHSKDSRSLLLKRGWIQIVINRMERTQRTNPSR